MHHSGRTNLVLYMSQINARKRTLIVRGYTHTDLNKKGMAKLEKLRALACQIGLLALLPANVVKTRC